MLDNQLKEEWVVALESGVYKQCHSYLSYKNTHCPMGVLADILSKKPSRKVRWEESRHFPYSATFLRYEGSLFISVLPEELLDNIGLSRKVQLKIISLNDFHHLSFKEIAQFIRTNTEI